MTGLTASRHSAMSGGATFECLSGYRENAPAMETTRPAAGYGRGRKSTPSTAPKLDVASEIVRAISAATPIVLVHALEARRPDGTIAARIGTKFKSPSEPDCLLGCW